MKDSEALALQNQLDANVERAVLDKQPIPWFRAVPAAAMFGRPPASPPDLQVQGTLNHIHLHSGKIIGDVEIQAQGENRIDIVFFCPDLLAPLGQHAGAARVFVTFLN